MYVTVNGDQCDIDDQTSVEALLSNLRGCEGDSRGVAVAVNDEVVPRQKWPALILKNEDRVLVITATQGG